MKFVDMLRKFSLEGHEAAFTAAEFSIKLRVNALPPEIIDAAKARLLSVKRVSADLDRLFRMGFMKRKRLKRKLITKGGLVVYRGYEYEYKISKQGWQYLEFLRRQGQTKPPSLDEQFEKAVEAWMAQDIWARNSGIFAEMLREGMSDKQFEDRGRHKRFPTAKYAKLLEELKICREKLMANESELALLRNRLR